MRQSVTKMLVTPANKKDFLTRFKALFGPMEKDVREASLAVEGPLMDGRLEVHSIRSGMRLFVMNLDLYQDMDVNIEAGGSGVLLSLVLDGSSDYVVPRSAGRHDQWEYHAGRDLVGTFFPEMSRWHIHGRNSHRFVELQVSSGRALQLSSEYLGSTSGALQSLLKRTNEFPVLIQQPLRPELAIVAHHVLNCGLQGPARRLFMESKALELLALQLTGLSSGVRRPAKRSRQEIDRLEEARRVLDREFVDPPSLLTLARRVGLNDFKLKNGFRDLYQTTVFGYVRMLKMEKARSLLESGDLNVSEVAAATGYTCFGHFASAFRKRFGVLPREFKKARQPRGREEEKN